jgi:hypothetical protein
MQATCHGQVPLRLRISHIEDRAGPKGLTGGGSFQCARDHASTDGACIEHAPGRGQAAPAEKDHESW